MGADSQNGTSSSNLLNVPVTTGSRTVPGSTLGENLHTLVSPGEIPAHVHSITDVQHNHSYTSPALGAGTGTTPNYFYSSVVGSTTSSSYTGITGTNSTGTGGAHNTVERSIIVNWNLKL
jgi:hypothetical protein